MATQRRLSLICGLANDGIDHLADWGFAMRWLLKWTIATAALVSEGESHEVVIITNG